MKPTRAMSPPGTYFITTTTWGRRALFRSERWAGLFLDVLYHYRAGSKFLLHAFVVMPDHIHLLVTPANSVTLERAVQLIKGGYSYRVGRELQSRAEVWERGFIDHRVRDAQDYLRHRAYIHDNPVHAGLAEHGDEFPYSSAHSGFELDAWPPAAKADLVSSPSRHG